MPQWASSFQRLDHLRVNDGQIYYYNETWCNTGDEKRSVWFTDSGEGSLGKSSDKEKRLAVLAMINKSGVDRHTIDIFLCNKGHSMDSSYFIE